MSIEKARAELSARYNVDPEGLQYAHTWEIPELGKIVLLFHIVDQAHIRYGSTVSYDVCMKETEAAITQDFPRIS